MSDISVSAITNQQLADVTNKMRTIDTKWKVSIAEAISKTDTWKEYSNKACTDTQVAHISKGEVKNSMLRLLFLESCNEIIKSYNKRKRKVEQSLR